MERNGTQVDLFIAILVRFPYIGTIHCDPESGTLRLVFLLREAHQDFQNFAQRFEAHLVLFHQLRDRKATVASLRKTENAQLTMVEVIRDMASISLVELKLIVQLILDYYGDSVIKEGPEVQEEDAVEQEMMIEALLMAGSPRQLERLTGFREDGRVLVFSTAQGVSRQ